MSSDQILAYVDYALILVFFAGIIGGVVMVVARYQMSAQEDQSAGQPEAKRGKKSFLPVAIWFGMVFLLSFLVKKRQDTTENKEI